MVVAAVVLAIGIEIPGSKTPAHPVVHTADAVARGADFSVAVTVENEGQKTAQNVQVEASLDTGSGEETSDQVVAFLAGQASEELVFIFSSDPGEGRLRREGHGLPGSLTRWRSCVECRPCPGWTSSRSTTCSSSAEHFGRSGADSSTLEVAAQGIAQHLRDNLVGVDGAPACPLVRLYKTHRFAQLPPDLQVFAQEAVGGDDLGPETRCLVLLGSAARCRSGTTDASRGATAPFRW